MFDVIHEFAVLGTTFFMMAIRSIWYSPTVFGRYVSKVKIETPSSEEVWKFRARLFGLLLVAEGILAYALVTLREAPLSVVAAIFGCVGIYAAITGLQILEKRLSVIDYLIHLGFFILWLAGSVTLLHYWPW